MDPFDLNEWPEFTKVLKDFAGSSIVDQIVIDSRRINSHHSLFVALPGIYEDGHRFVVQAAKAGAKFALVKKSWEFSEIPEGITLLRVDDPLRSFQQIVSAYRKKLKAKVIGITGSYGKTMVKDLLHSILSHSKITVASPESFNSQIGVPLSLLTIRQEHEIALIEVGISKKQEMDYLTDLVNPNCGIVTHIGKRHLATLGDLQSTASETIKLMKKIPKSDWVLAPSNRALIPFLRELDAQFFFWNKFSNTLPHAKTLGGEHHSVMKYGIEFPSEHRFTGEATSGFYYLLDLLNICTKAAWLLGASAQDIATTLQNYVPEPMRTEIWKAPTGTTFINDTYCSDPLSIDTALRHLDQVSKESRKVFLFSGLKGKKQHLEADYRRIGKAINRSDVKLLFLVGSHPFTPLIEQIQSHSPHIEIACCDHFQEALIHLRSRLRTDDTVLIKGDRKYPLDLITETFNESVCNNQCIINLAAIEANLFAIRKKLPDHTRIMVMVKAFAYGMDDVRIAKFLERCKIDILGVSYVDEGVTLRRAGVRQNIFVINAAIYEVFKIVKWELEVGLSDKAFVEALQKEAEKQAKKIKVHLHVDTGMSRFGCRPEEVYSLVQTIQYSSNLQLEGIMTHFAAADNPSEDEFTLSQSQKFDEVIQQLLEKNIEIPWKHAANSSAAIRFSFPQYNMIRIGLAMYGLHSSEATKSALELRLALSLVSRIVGINLCKKGETISYGRSYTVARDFEKIAVLPIGYFDGLHRNYSGKGHVIVRGLKAPMVGKICMDYMMVNVSDIPHVAPGDTVLIFGEDEYGHYLSPENLATQGDSIVYELITCLGPRIQRIFVHEETFTKEPSSDFAEVASNE